MIRIAIYLLISVATIVSGWIAFEKLNYWERSVMIFRVELSEQSERTGQRRFEEGRTGDDTRDGRSDRVFPDSLDRRSGHGRGRFTGFREVPDSLRKTFEAIRENDTLRRGSFAGFRGEGPGRGTGMRGRGGHGDESYNGKKVYLKNVWLFLAVFSAFTIVALYVDKSVIYLRKKYKKI